MEIDQIYKLCYSSHRFINNLDNNQKKQQARMMASQANEIIEKGEVKSQLKPQQKFIIYPYQIVQTNKKLENAEKIILKISQNAKEKQLNRFNQIYKQKLEKAQKINKEKVHDSIYHHADKHWKIQDEIDSKYAAHMQQCTVFYQKKLSSQQARYSEIICSNQSRLRAQNEQILNLHQQVQQLQKQAIKLKNRIKKLESQADEIKCSRKNQKQRITEMLIKEKEEIFGKYTVLEKENMVLLEFANKIGDILQKKSFVQDQYSGKMPYIKEIQLQASNYYSNLNNPILQQILNAFTQDINLLNKRIQRQRADSKGKKNDRTDKSNSTTDKPVTRLKLASKQKLHSQFEIANLKQQISKLEKSFQQKKRQQQDHLSLEQEKSAKLVKKIEKLEDEIERKNKQFEIFHQKQEDLMKKIKWLQEEVLDFERKLKMQNQQFQIYQRGNSLQNISHQSELQNLETRNKSKSAFVNKISLQQPSQPVQSLSKQNPSQHTISMSMVIPTLKNQLRSLHEKLQQKQQQLKNRQMFINQLQQKNLLILAEKNNEIHQFQVHLHQKQGSIHSLKEKQSTLTHALGQAREQVQELYGQIRGKDEQIQEMQAKIDDKNREICGIQEKILEKQHQFSKLVNQIKCKNEVIKKIERQMNQLKQNIERLNENAVNLKQEQEKNKKKIKEMESEKIQLKDLIIKSEENSKNNQEQTDRLNKQNNMLKDRIEKLETKIQILQKQNIDITKIAENLNQKQKQQNNRILELSKQLQIREQKIKELALQIQEKQKIMNQYKDNQDKFKRINSVLEEQHKKLEQKIGDKYQRQKLICEEVIQQYEIKTKKQDQQLKQINQTLQQRNRQIQQLQKQNQIKIKENANQNKQSINNLIITKHSPQLPQLQSALIQLSHLEQQNKSLNKILIQKTQQMQQLQVKISKMKIMHQKQVNNLQNALDQTMVTVAQMSQTIAKMEAEGKKLRDQAKLRENEKEKEKERERETEAEKERQKKSQKVKKNKNGQDDAYENQHDNQNQIQNDQNFISSKDLSIMHSEIKNFKVQLNGLQQTIEQKNRQIACLNQQLQKFRNQKTSSTPQKTAQPQKIGFIERKKAKTFTFNPNPSPPQAECIPCSIPSPRSPTNPNKQVQKLKKLLIQKQRQLQKYGIQQTKHEILLTNVKQLEATLQKQKQLYQSQLNRYNVRIFQLEDQLRRVKDSKDKDKDNSNNKRKVFSQEYFSLYPSSLKFQSSKHRTSQNASNNFKTVKGRVETQENQSQVYHSLEEDYTEQSKQRTQQKQQLQLQEKQQKTKQCKIRRQKSQQYDRPITQTLKLQKLSSIQRRYESDQKQKPQKVQKSPNPQQQSPSPMPPSPSPLPEPKSKLPLNPLNSISMKHPLPTLSHEQLPVVCSPSQNSALNQIIKGLTFDNRELKYLNNNLLRDIKQLSYFVEILTKKWSNKKGIDGVEADQMVSIDRLLDNFRVIQNQKHKLIEEFNVADLKAMFDNVNYVVKETKKWVDVIEQLTNQNKKLIVQMSLYKKFPKLVKTKTLKFGEIQQHHRRSRSVYSQGNVYRQHQIDMDESPYQMHDEQAQPHTPYSQYPGYSHNLHPQIHPSMQNNQQASTPINSSLEFLFRENNQMSEISSVKHKSYNSGFLNSKSQIAKMFEKGEKFERQHRQQRRQQHKRDIVDQYAILNPNHKDRDRQKHQKLQKQREKLQKQREKQKFQKNRPNPSPNPNISQNISTSTHKIHSRIHTSLWQNSPLMQKNQTGYIPSDPHFSELRRIHKFQQKSNKSKTDFLIMLCNKLENTKKQLEYLKKGYANWAKTIMERQEERTTAMKNQFANFMKKVVESGVINAEMNEKDREKLKQERDLSREVGERISQRDEQLYERLEEIEGKLDIKVKQIQQKERNMAKIKQGYEKRILQQRITNQNLLKNLNDQIITSQYLKLKLQKSSKDFKQFISKIAKHHVQQKTNFPLPLTLPSPNKNQIQVQTDLYKSQSKQQIPIQKAKSFLKGKKVTKAETSPQLQQSKSNANQTVSGDKQIIASNNSLTSLGSGQLQLQKKQQKKQLKQIKLEPKQKKQQIVRPQIRQQMNDQKQQPKQQSKQPTKQQQKQQPILFQPTLKKTQSDMPIKQLRNSSPKKQPQQQFLPIQKSKTQQPSSTTNTTTISQPKAENENGKVKTFTDLISSIINNNAKSIKKQKTLEELSLPQQIKVYKNSLMMISKQLKNLFQSHSLRKNFVYQTELLEEQRQVLKENGREMQKSGKQGKQESGQNKNYKKQRQSRLKTQQQQQQKEKQKDKEKEKDKDKAKSQKQKQKQKQKQQLPKIKTCIQIMQIIKNLSLQITNKKQEMEKSITQRQYRLKQIIKSIIVSFRISKKAIDKIIQQKQRKDMQSTYINSHQYFKSIYKQLKPPIPLPSPSSSPSPSLSPSVSPSSTPTPGPSQEPQQYSQLTFQSFQQKYTALLTQNKLLQSQLETVTKQLTALKSQPPPAVLSTPLCQSQALSHAQDRKMPSHHSFTYSNSECQENFQQFQNKQIFDNTKLNHYNYNEIIAEFKTQIQGLKKKLQKYQAGGKGKAKYIRNW